MCHVVFLAKSKISFSLQADSVVDMVGSGEALWYWSGVQAGG